MESDKTVDLNNHLNEIKRKRRNGEDEFLSVKRRNEEVNDYLEQKLKYINRQLNSSIVASDPKKSAKLEERKKDILKWREEEEAFKINVEQDWRRFNDSLDDEEYTIEKELAKLDSKDNDNTFSDMKNDDNVEVGNDNLTD